MIQDNSQILLDRLKADDQTAIKEIFHSYYALVYKTLLRFIKEQQTIEDLAQNVFMRFWEKRHQLHIQGPIAPYIKRMAVNEALGHIRKNNRLDLEEEVEEYALINLHAEQDADQDYMYGEMKKVIGQAIEQLPPKCQTVFKLSRYEELSYKEIAEKMEISPKTVENQMGRALKLLKKMLKKYLYIFF